MVFHACARIRRVAGPAVWRKEVSEFSLQDRRGVNNPRAAAS